MARYKWDSAYEWLKEKAFGWDVNELQVALLDFARAAGNDEIQDRYQSEMDDDGFFQDLDITQKLDGLACIRLLVEAGEDEQELVDGEITVEQMQQKVQAYIEDGTLTYNSVEDEVR